MLRYILVLLICCVGKVYANDTVAAAATGNIVFQTAPELIIQDETLTITHAADKKFLVDVDFHIKNTSKHDVTRKIAFVMPPVKCGVESNSMWRGLDSSDPGLKDFTTKINQRHQTMTVREEAVMGSKNITATLTKLNIPLNPCKILDPQTGQPDVKYLTDLKQNKLLTANNEPAWEERIYFEWQQKFPAGQVINIHHRYTPVFGGSVLSPRSVKDITSYFNHHMTPIWNRPLHKKSYCVTPMWIEYHLTSGANWKGGISVFKLLIKNDTESHFAVNKFYKSQDTVVESIKDNSMEFEIENFVPKQNLFILFLVPPKTKEELQMCGN